MQGRGEVTSIRGLSHIYEVIVPYARMGHLAEDEVLMDAHPYAALSHLSALLFHGLTNDLPKGVTAIAPRDGTGDQLPLGTEPDDWPGVPLVRGRLIPSVLERPVHWSKIKPEHFFGLTVYQPRGYPIRVTNRERTLLDGLQAPELCGGAENVLRAWVRARDTLDLDLLVDYVDRFNVGVLRQRTGFILDELALAHPLVEAWRGQARRGGSSRLVGAAPYAPLYSERWNLSLNAPVEVLRQTMP
jgi:predicted transcriptional regulator of viral defense system